MNSSPAILRGAVAAAVFIATSAASGQSQTVPTFSLDIAAPAAQEVQLAIPSPTTLSFKIMRGGGPVPTGFAVDVGNFINPQGIIVPVSVSIGSDPDTGATHVEPGAFTQGLLAVNLHVKTFPAPGKYTGQVIVTTPGADATSTLWRFVLSSASEVRPATLVIDQNALTLVGARAFCLWPSDRSWCLGDKDDPLVVTVHVRDKTGTWPLVGVTSRMESGLKTPRSGFDTSSLIAVEFNGQAVPDFFSAPTAPGTASSSQPTVAKDGRLVSAGAQATVMLTFKPREVGEYTIPMRFTAANSADDDLQKLTVTLQIRNSILPAIFVLLFAAALSFLATRVISMLRQRAAFLARLRTLRPAWLANEPSILPVIWLRATSNLAEALNKRFWLLGSSEIDARLTAAAAMLLTLDRVRQVRGRIEAIPEEMVQQRAIWKLDKVVDSLGAASLSDQDVANFKAQLDAFDSWCDPDRGKRQIAYWADLLPAIQSICSQVDEVTIPAADQQNLAKLLKQALETSQTQATTLDQQIKAEENYQRLAILLELCRRGQTNLIGGLGKTLDDVSIRDVRAIVDNAWWALLNDPATKLTVEGPSATMDPPETYESVTFRVNTPAKPFLVETYLMDKKLTYDWTISITSKKDAATPKQLRVTSSQPRIAQYSPIAGSMTASVHISYEGASGSRISGEPVTVIHSSDFKIFAKYEWADLIGFGVATAASVVSGLTLYALKPTFFGSLQDYLTLFTWGASIDQGKNFLQSLGAYATTTSKPTSQGGGGA
jgi:hypothetical protein